ncbi:MAG: glycosyltransferase family 4 protein [Candidatus Absconditabacterales bacterium]
MKHIFFVIDYYFPHRGGLENVFENIIKRLLDKGYKISILTSRFDKKLNKNEKKGNLNIYRIGKNRWQFILFSIWKGIGILKKNKDISLIHTSTYGGAIPASLLGRLFKKKVVLTVHEIFGKLWNNYKGNFVGWRYKIFEKLIFSMPYDIYHCVSFYTMNCIRIYYGIPDRKIKMIYNGVDYDFWDIKKVENKEIQELKNKYGWENRFVVLYYGHAGKSKGIDYLIQAILKIVEKNKNILFVFNLIDSKRTEKIKNEIKYLQKNLEIKNMLDKDNLKIGKNIQIFNGFEKEELRKLVASCDLVIAPSLSEGFGSVHTETVAMGKPLVTTNVASLPEVVRGNVKFISPSRTDEIINAINKFKNEIENNNFENEMIPKKNFSWDETVEKIIRVYGE